MKKNGLLMSVIILLSGFPILSWASNGYFLHGIGAVNESLGGASTAGNSQDVLGSIYKNPANAMLFQGKVGSVSLSAILPDVSLKSSVTALGLSGTSDSDVDVIPLGNLALVVNDGKCPLTWYAAVIGEAGLHLDVPQSSSNPIFMAQAGKPDNPFSGIFGGFGAVETQMELIRIPLGVSFQLNNKWSLGFSAAPSVNRLKFTPAAFAAPDDADGNGAVTYPTDVDNELAFGMGFQFGVRYQTTDMLDIGFSLTSPTWFEDFEWDVTDELGNTRKVSHHIDRPMSLQVGLAYKPIPETLLLLDISWFNFSDTAGTDETGFNADGSLKGLGWDDQWVITLGVQQDISNDWTLRAGYNYGTSPIDEDIVFYNLGTPLHNQHHLSIGASWKIIEDTVLDLGYTHAFESSKSGQWYDATGSAVPGTDVKGSLSYDQLSIGITRRF